MPPFIDSGLREFLEKKGIGKMYSHQVEGLQYLHEGKNVIVTTPTGSGKTLIYNLSAANRIKHGRENKALYIFPTKALTQDQLKKVREFDFLTAEIYDGDTPADVRQRIKRKPPDILLTNPDMLHVGLLPFHHTWRSFLSKLTFIVIDEVHTYKGIFGSQVAHVIRRLRRICSHYGSSPQFILLSATINKPADFAEKIAAAPFTSVEKSSAPTGKKHFVFMDTELDSPYPLAINMLLESMESGLSAIVFTRSRKASELLQVWTHQRLGATSEAVSAYRAGYLAEERRAIEKKLFSGEMKGVIATSALELGMDVGSLDCCILFGYPGSITSTWQRIGRVGRGKKNSIVIFIGMQDALDQYFIKNPGEFFKRTFEDVIINPENRIISENHLKCASAELPIEEEDIILYGDYILETLEKKPFMKAPGSRRYCYLGKPPHRDINIRSIGDIFSISEAVTGKVVGEIEENKVFSECYPGSIYLHHGKKYEVIFINEEAKSVAVKNIKADFYTQPNWWEKIEILEEKAQRGGKYTVKSGIIEVTTQVISYEKRRENDKTLISLHQLSLPPQNFQTESVWIEIPEDTVIEFKKRDIDFHGSIHAAEHSIISIFPLAVTCDRWDIGGYSFPFHRQTKSAAIFIYDGYPGGVGIAGTAYDRFSTILKSAYDITKMCKCESGCPSCIQSPKCGSNNNPLDKAGALLLLKDIINGEQGEKTNGKQA